MAELTRTAIHPTALIHPSAQLDDGVEIGPYAIVEEHVVLGARTTIGSHSIIKRYTQMGRENRVAEHAVIGGDPQDYKYKDCPSYVSIGDANLIREGVTIHRASRPESPTRIGDNCFLMADSHVAHDCTVGDRVIIVNGAMLAGSVSIDDAAFISGNVVIHQFCRVGRLAMAAGGARLVQDCLPFMITEGAPGRARALNVVGLRRAGMDAAEIRRLKHALHILRTTAGLEQALQQMETDASPAVAELVGFIRTSARGFSHPRR
jgi:UDP-N-acetylglucosamine acyltransferase